MHFDLTPFYKSTVGFDRMFSLLDQAAETGNGYPPYNIERTGDDEYRITMAVAGFGENDLKVEVKENTLIVSGEKAAGEEETKGDFLYQGIAARAFERRFRLADFVEVKDARLENGLLHLELKRELPEAMKPRTIKISTAKSGGKTIEHKAAA